MEQRARAAFTERPGPERLRDHHVDYILGNVRLARRDGAWRAGVIDFDDCGFGFFLYDLGPAPGFCSGIPRCGAP